MPVVESPLPDEELRHLQEALLKAVLSGEPLPGSDRPVRFPDLSFILRQPAVILLDENLAGSISAEELPMPVRILSLEVLLEEARTQGDTAYLQFQPAEREDDTVRLTLQAKIATRVPDQPTLGLSGIMVEFQKVSEGWEATGDPVFLAT